MELTALGSSPLMDLLDRAWWLPGFITSKRKKRYHSWLVDSFLCTTRAKRRSWSSDRRLITSERGLKMPARELASSFWLVSRSLWMIRRRYSLPHKKQRLYPEHNSFTGEQVLFGMWRMQCSHSLGAVFYFMFVLLRRHVCSSLLLWLKMHPRISSPGGGITFASWIVCGLGHVFKQAKVFSHLKSLSRQFILTGNAY